MSLEKIILEHIQKYPQMTSVDILKLIYQNEFGVGHLISNEEDARLQLKNELYEKLPVLPYFVEEIGEKFCRSYLHSLKKSVISFDTFLAMFLNSADVSQGTREGFISKCDEVKELCKENGRDISQDLSVWKSSINEPFRHSEIYRRAYRPAYRVMRAEYGTFFSLFCKIDKLKNSKENLVIAIDGNCCSGKTELAKLLKTVYSCDIIEMDHFFLQSHQRTESRLSEIGGNIDYERFDKEVLQNFANGSKFSYEPYQCETLSFGDNVTVDNSKMRIVEGSYSMHPKFSFKYDLKVFLSVSSDKQTLRISNRNGKEMLDVFIDKWIPMENKYFHEYGIKEKSDINFVT